jgi:hypothetical protein
MHGQNSQMKVQGPCLVHSFIKKNEKKPFDSRCKMVKTKVVLKGLGVEENGPRA